MLEFSSIVMLSVVYIIQAAHFEFMNFSLY